MRRAIVAAIVLIAGAGALQGCVYDPSTGAYVPAGGYSYGTYQSYGGYGYGYPAYSYPDYSYPGYSYPGYGYPGYAYPDTYGGGLSFGGVWGGGHPRGDWDGRYREEHRERRAPGPRPEGRFRPDVRHDGNRPINLGVPRPAPQHQFQAPGGGGQRAAPPSGGPRGGDRDRDRDRH